MAEATDGLNLFTISADQPFVDVLVRAVLDGFPLPAETERPPLSKWTILVPNRRTAQGVQKRFLELASSRALILPRIRPIGDLNDDFFDDAGPPEELPPPMTAVARHFALIQLIIQWSDAHAHLALAVLLKQSPAQADQLARSLGQLIDSLEVEERELHRLREAFDLDLAHHREAILSLLALIHQELPALQLREGLIGAKDRRSRLIRLNAHYLMKARHDGPVIAAGSTGTVPATRHLLKVISNLPQGAVVLPGLDLGMDEPDWQAVNPQHPQFAMKTLLSALEVTRRDVALLGKASAPRFWLAQEAMRPSDVSEAWAEVLPRSRAKILEAIKAVEFFRGRDRREEAAVIAALMRYKLGQAEGSVALITPDAVLARRVKAELRRFHVIPHDSHGDPLICHGGAAFIGLLIDLAIEPGSPLALSAVLHHPASRFTYTKEDFTHFAGAVDVTLLRSPLCQSALLQFPDLLTAIPAAAKRGIGAHPPAVDPNGENWPPLALAASRIYDWLQPLTTTDHAPFTQHVQNLLDIAQGITAPELWGGEDAVPLAEIFQQLMAEGERLPPLSFSAAASLTRSYLQAARLVVKQVEHPRAFIVGLLEARLLRFDSAILGGLNEGIWPGTTDTGPWLNRSMRDVLDIQQPEAAIGQMAHDFVQGFCSPEVFITWSGRDGADVLLPSRWVLRLQTLLASQNLGLHGPLCHKLSQHLAHQTLSDTTPAAMPHFAPPLSARPKKISITQVRKLIDDPYAIYARDVLKLTPLDNLGQDVAHKVRGQLFHLALADYFTLHPHNAPPDMMAALLKAAAEAFALWLNKAEVATYLEPRFRRVAQWLVHNAQEFHGDHSRLIPEAITRYELLPDGAMTISGRADLIRLAGDGTARLFDFKTGQAGPLRDDAEHFTFQLTLEAALLANGAFKDCPPTSVDGLRYVEISGGVPPARFKDIAAATLDRSGEHLHKLTDLLKAYAEELLPYLPRANVKAEGAVMDYDHLSRYREWFIGDAS